MKTAEFKPMLANEILKAKDRWRRLVAIYEKLDITEEEVDIYLLDEWEKIVQDFDP